MQETRYQVQAEWDSEAAVWVATSADVPGLATESESREALASNLRVMIPELLAANCFFYGTASFFLELTSHPEEHVPLSS